MEMFQNWKTPECIYPDHIAVLYQPPLPPNHNFDNVTNDKLSSTMMTLFSQAPLVHLEKLLYYKLGLAKLPSVRRIKSE